MIVFDRVERATHRFAAGLAFLGGLGLIFAIAATCLSILMKLARRSLDALWGTDTVGTALPWLHAILGEEELVTYGVGLALFAALPWVMINKGHIKVDLFEPLFSGRFNRFLDLLGDLILCALAWLILTRQWFLIFKPARRSQEPLFDLLLQGDLVAALARMETKQESQILGLPLWPTYIAAELCVLAFFLVACVCVWRSARAFLSAPHSESAA